MIKVVLNRQGVRSLLRSSEMKSICESEAHKLAKRCGSDGYEVDTYTGINRVNASVKTNSNASTEDNYKNNTLVKAVSR